MKYTRWVKIPGPGEFRGEGEWKVFDGTEDDWQYLQFSAFLPTFEGLGHPDNQEQVDA